MFTPSPLFKRITTCSNAIRHLKKEKDGDGHHSSYEEVSSYDQVVQFIPGDTVKDHPNTKDVISASLQYMKRGWRDPTDDAKAKIALYVAILIAYDNAKYGLAKEVCDRFRGIDDFDRDAMDKIFNLSLCNDRVRELLDNAMIHKTNGIRPAIKKEKDIEFIEIFFNLMMSLVGDGHTLADLGYTAKVTSTDMKRAQEIIEEHLGDIASKCSPCFKQDVLRPPRKQNNLFPAGDAFPHVSIGREPVKYEDATTDKLKKAKKTIAKLKESLMDKDEKGEFLEMMFAIVSHASNKDNPVVTYRILTLDSVKKFFMAKVLDKAQADETQKAILTSDEARELQEKVEHLEEENSSLKQQLLEEKEKVSSLEKQNSSREVKYRELCKANPALEAKIKELEYEQRRLQIALALTERNEKHLQQDRESLVKKKPKLSQKQINDLAYDMFRRGS